MNVFQTITSKASEARLPFLMIGGYAVMAHGFVRSTEDLDLLVCESQRGRWRELLEVAGLTVHHDGGTFLQFNAPPWGKLPVDLMLVADDVFGRMQLKAEKTKFEGVEAGVVSLIQLIALKSHSMNNSDKKLRRVKDTDDLIQLIQRNGLSLQERSFGRRYSSMETKNSIRLQRAFAPDCGRIARCACAGASRLERHAAARGHDDLCRSVPVERGDAGAVSTTPRQR